MPTLQEQILAELQSRMAAVAGVVLPVDRGDVAATERGDRPSIAIIETGFRIDPSQCGCYWRIVLQPIIRIVADSAADRDAVLAAAVAALAPAWPVLGVQVFPVDSKSLVARVDQSPWAYLVQLETKGLRCKAYHLDQQA